MPEDGLYKYLLQPNEEHDNQRRRAMNRVWSKATYRLREIIDAGSCVMYYLRDGVAERPWAHRAQGPESTLVPTLQKAFVSEELMLILEDTELPPDYIQEW